MTERQGDERARDALIEETAGAYRPDRRGQVGSLAAWHDLDEAGRIEAFRRAGENCRLEAATHPDRRSSTVAAVLNRIAGRR